MSSVHSFIFVTLGLLAGKPFSNESNSWGKPVNSMTNRPYKHIQRLPQNNVDE